MAKLYSEKKRTTSRPLTNIVFVILFLQACISGNLSGRDELATILIALQMLVFVPATVILWLPHVQSTLAERIINTVFFCTFVFPSAFLSFKTAVTVHLFLVFPVGLWAFYLLFVQRKKTNGIFPFPSMLLLMLLLSLGLRASYYNRVASGVSTRLFVIPLILGIAAGIFLSIKLLWHVSVFKSETKNQRIVLLFISIFLCSYALSTLASSINYAFDKAEPQRIVAVIEEKQTHRTNNSRRHHRTYTYNFSVRANGDTFRIDVPATEYNSYDVGDTYIIYQYGGALGEPYYVPENLSE